MCHKVLFVLPIVVQLVICGIKIAAFLVVGTIVFLLVGAIWRWLSR